MLRNNKGTEKQWHITSLENFQWKYGKTQFGTDLTAFQYRVCGKPVKDEAILRQGQAVSHPGRYGLHVQLLEKVELERLTTGLLSVSYNRDATWIDHLVTPRKNL